MRVSIDDLASPSCSSQSPYLSALNFPIPPKPVREECHSAAALSAGPDGGIRPSTARGEAVDRLTPLLEEAVECQNRLHRPARRRARAAGFVLALALAAALALAVQWRFAIIETPDPTDGWRGHLWERYGSELRDCVTQAERQGKAMLCQVFDPGPELP